MENSFNQSSTINLPPETRSPRFAKIYKITRSPLAWMISSAILVTIIVALIVVLAPKNTPDITYEVSTDRKIHIDNLAELLPNFPEDYKENLESELYLQATSDLLNISKPTPASGAIIRSGTLNAEDVNDNLHIGDFIIDIPSVEISYQISYNYGRDLDGFQIEPFASATIYCIEDEKLRIYPSFNEEYCYANYHFHPSSKITYITPYESEDGSYSISWVYNSSAPSGYGLIVHYEPFEKDISTPESLQKFESSVNEKIKSWLSENNLSPDDYTLHHESEGEAL